MRKSTMVELVTELESLLSEEKDVSKRVALQFMIKEAKAGEYHDYKNEKYVCGKFESATRLDTLGYHSLADRIKNGEFDEEADEEDRKNMKEFAPKELWNVLKL